MTTPQFLHSFTVGKWLIERLHNDEELLKSLMGGGRKSDKAAMADLESEVAAFGWSRHDIDKALQLIAVN